MKITKLSASRWSTYTQCPYKYMLRYHLEKPVLEKSDAAEFGSWIHESLEFYIKDGKDIKETLKETIKNYEFSSDYLRKVSPILNNFLKVDANLDRGSAESEFTLDIGGQVPITGIIDRLILKNGVARVIDYKTGTYQKGLNELSKDLQLRMYCLAVNKMYQIPYESIKLTLFYVLTGTQVNIQYTNNQIEEFKSEATTAISDIISHDPECARPKINKFCGYCEFRSDCQNYILSRSRK